MTRIPDHFHRRAVITSPETIQTGNNSSKIKIEYEYFNKQAGIKSSYNEWQMGQPSVNTLSL